jgi:hypothetical protein
VIQSIKEKSAEYRCTQFSRLMIFPVMARDGNFFEQSMLETEHFLSIDQFVPSSKKKAHLQSSARRV